MRKHGGNAYDVMSWIPDLMRLKQPDAVADCALNFIQDFGFASILICRPPRRQEPFKKSVLAGHFPAELLDYYSDNDCASFDPVVQRMKQHRMPFRRSDLHYDPKLQPRVHELVQVCNEFGFRDCLVVPVYGQSGLAGSVLINFAKLEMSDKFVPAVHLLALYAFHHVHSLHMKAEDTGSLLSGREREVLTWVAAGKSAREIGEILGIAKRTVDEHALSACHKLDAANRSQAVAIAVRDGLIEA